MTDSLGVWLDGDLIAELEQRRWPEIRCRYTEQALGRWPLNSPVISCSLPLGAHTLDALPFCVGLLPEGRALDALARDAGLAVNDTFELLRRYGRDIAGALVISENEPDDGAFGVEAYDEDGLASAVADLEDHPLGSHDDSELSLAGLQDKLLLVRTADGWGRPLRGRPSTHILKIDDLRYPGLIDGEWECLRLARAVGLTSVDAELVTIADQRCLIVSRFDRREDRREGVVRVHQEDACQALGVDPSAASGRAKYELAGGPSLRQIAGLLDAYATSPSAELERLVEIVIFTVLIGNADAHGKNVAFLHESPRAIRLAPLYDTVPTALWDKLRTDAAMSIGAKISLPDVTLEDVEREAAAWPLARKRATEIAEATASRVGRAVDDAVIDPEGAVASLVRGTLARFIGS